LGVGSADPAAFAAILERPIFAPDRRQPPPPAPPAPPPPPDPLANISIHGIFSGASAGVLARIDGKQRRIKINEKIGPWTLKSIDGRDITFTQGDEDRKLRLAFARLDTPVPPQAAAAAVRPAQTPVVPLSAAALGQKAQDEVRDRLKRRNELRASRGLPPLAE
jgi:hypothetical protein